jgi:hypothetical protein
MAFNWKAFAASFLDKQTEGIRERRAEAKEFEEEQEELAKQNRRLIAERTNLANSYGQLGQKAMALGATKEQVMAAMASGAQGIQTFYEKLLKAANQKGISTLGPADVEAIIDMPEVFEVNPEYIDMNLNELAQIQYGAKMKPGTRPADVQTSDSVLATLFGVNAMDQAKQKLQDTKAVGGMSIADINELAAQSEYNSLFPNLGVNFFDKEFYGPESASKFLRDLVEIETDAAVGPAAELLIREAGMQFEEKMKTENPDEETAAWIAEQKRLNRTFRDAEAEQRELLIQQAAESVIEGAIGTYGETGLFYHEPSVNIMKRIMGDDWVNGEIELIKNFNQQEQPEETQPEPSSEQPPNTEQNQEEQTQETTETETSDTTNQETQIPTEESPQELTIEEKKEALLAKTFPTRASQRGLASKGIWDRKYEGKVDEQGKIIIAPPRPDEGGEKTKEIPITTGLFDSPTGKKKKVTEAEYWDATYGETHDPVTGLPLGIDELLED